MGCMLIASLVFWRQSHSNLYLIMKNVRYFEICGMLLKFDFSDNEYIYFNFKGNLRERNLLRMSLVNTT